MKRASMRIATVLFVIAFIQLLMSFVSLLGFKWLGGYPWTYSAAEFSVAGALALIAAAIFERNDRKD